MIEQLTVKELYIRLEQVRKELGLTGEEFEKLPIYLGDDDEMNGIHCAWYCEGVDADNEDDEDIVEMINERRGNVKLNGKGILIS